MKVAEIVSELKKSISQATPGKNVQISRDMAVEILGELEVLKAYQNGEISRDHNRTVPTNPR